MAYLNILQQGPCCIGNGFQEVYIEAIGKDFQGIYRNRKTRDKHIQANSSVSVLGGHLDGVCTANEASILYFYPGNFYLFSLLLIFRVKCPSLSGQTESRSLCSQHIFQIHGHTGERERLYPADIINSVDTH
jgi:hypothetical protein